MKIQALTAILSDIKEAINNKGVCIEVETANRSFTCTPDDGDDIHIYVNPDWNVLEITNSHGTHWIDIASIVSVEI